MQLVEFKAELSGQHGGWDVVATYAVKSDDHRSEWKVETQTFTDLHLVAAWLHDCAAKEFLGGLLG